MCHYFKGVQQIRPDIAVIRPAFDDLVVRSKSGPLLKMSVLFEYYPTNKIMSVPQGETAFQRKPFSNVMFTSLWKDDTPESLEFARTCAREFTGKLEQREEGLAGVYGNYGDFALHALLKVFELMTSYRRHARSCASD